MSNPFIPNNTNTQPPMPGSSPAASSAQANNAFEINLTDVQESSYVIPDGTYRAKCTEIEQNVSKSGNPMFVWTFTITNGDFTGREFKSWTAITPAAMWKVAETVIALGIGQIGQVVKFKRSDVLNKECGLVIEKEEYNGKESSKVVRVISVAEYNSAMQ